MRLLLRHATLLVSTRIQLLGVAPVIWIDVFLVYVDEAGRLRIATGLFARDPGWKDLRQLFAFIRRMLPWDEVNLLLVGALLIAPRPGFIVDGCSLRAACGRLSLVTRNAVLTAIVVPLVDSRRRRL